MSPPIAGVPPFRRRPSVPRDPRHIRARSRRRQTRASPSGPSRQRGFATAELAACLPAVVLFLLAGLFAITAATAQVRCVDAAREAALSTARGETDKATALAHAPPRATLSIDTDDQQVRAEVSAKIRPLGNWLPAVEVTGAATAAMEPTGLEAA